MSSRNETDVNTLSPWTEVSGVDVEEINRGMVPGEPTVDVAIYYPNNLDSGHRSKVSIDLLVSGFRDAQRVFDDAGVQLRLLSLKTGFLDPKWFAIDSTAPGNELPSGRYCNMYVAAERRPSVASDDAAAAFEAIVDRSDDAGRIIHIVVLQDVFMSFFEQLDFRTWQLKTISTGGLSFPGYMYGATMPHHLRGVITITDLAKDANSWKTIAHELGHKLLNVSHEFRETSPQHEVRADGGLMLYGKGAEIPAGADGRFHRERLHVSPYIYRVDADGNRRWNPQYQGDGFYYDGIYDGISVDLDAEAET